MHGLKSLSIVFLVSLIAAETMAGRSDPIGLVEFKKIRMDANNEVHAVIFSVHYPADILIEGLSANLLPNKTASASTTICWGSNDCVCMPSSMSYQLGAASLECGNITLSSTPPNLDACEGDKIDYSPPEYLFPLPPSSDPFRSMLSLTGRLSSPVSITSNQVSFAVYTTFRDLAVDYIAPRFQDIDFATCRLLVSERVVYASSGSPVPSIVEDWVKPQTACTYSDLNRVGYEIESAITEVDSAGDWTSLNKIRWKIPMLEASHHWQACYKQMQSYLDSVEAVSQVYTSTCVTSKTDPEWEYDACCNPALRWEQCCLSRYQQFLQEYYLEVDETDTSQCKQQEKSNQLLLDIMGLLNYADDPETGCLATRLSSVNDDIFADASAFVRICQAKIIGDSFGLAQCEDNSDCYTTCIDGQCEVPWYSWDETFVRCYQDYMDPSIELTLRLMWGLTASDSPELFRQTFIQKLSDVNCVGLTSSSLTFVDGKYVAVNESVCLETKVCNWSRDYEGEDCIEGLGGRNFCGRCNGPVCTYLTRPESCFTVQQTSNPKACEAIGGEFDFTMDPYSCIFPNRNITECLPVEICPKYSMTDVVTATCDRPICYLPGVNETTCLEFVQDFECDDDDPNIFLPRKWDKNLAGGKGLCLVTLPVPSEATCLASNGTWFAGYSWNFDIHASEEDCQGVCSIGDYLYLALDKEECDNLKGCNMANTDCQSRFNRDLCYTESSPCDCIKNGGAYESTIGKCVYSLSQQNCTSKGYTFESCRSLDNNQCYECLINPSTCPLRQGYLGCAITRNVVEKEFECKDPEGGACADRVFYNSNPDCGRAVSFGYETQSNTDCFGSCVKQFNFDVNGRPYCDQFDGLKYSPLGCINTTIYTRNECSTLLGHTWIRLSLTEDECLYDKGQGCDLSETQTILHPMDADYCQQCGGEYRSNLKWRKSQWITGGFMKPTRWEPAMYLPTNNYTMTLNFSNVEITAQKAVASRYSGYFKTESLCKYQALVDSMRLVTCDCLDKVGAPSTCYSGDVRTVIVGVQRFCYGIEDWIRTGAIEMRVSRSSVPIELNCVDMTLASVPASQFKRKTSSSDSLSSDQLSKTTNDGINHPYAVVRYEDRIVGQIAGDGIQFLFNGEIQDVYMCLKRRKDISQDSRFTVPSFVARLNDTSFVPYLANINQTDLDMCATITLSSVGAVSLFPGYLDPKWMDDVEDDDNSPIYFTIAVFSIIWIVSGFKLIASSIMRKAMIQRVIYIQILVFSTARIVYLAMIVGGSIEDGSTTQFFLYDTPRMIFFSTYTTLVILWAEISADAVNITLGSLDYEPLYYGVNGCSYAVFSLILLLNSVLPEDYHMDIKYSYYSFLSLLSFGIALGFVLFGRRMYRKLAYTLIGDKQNKRQYMALKIGLVAVICSLAFFLQSAYVLITIAVDIDNVWIALIPFLVFEAGSCALLLSILRTDLKWRYFNLWRIFMSLGTWRSVDGDQSSG